MSTSFSGRSEGREVRKEHELDKKDGDGCVYDVYIPRNTTSINPSFFLGLFYSSIKKLGMEKFKKKYNSIDDGRAASRVLHLMKQLIPSKRIDVYYE